MNNRESIFRAYDIRGVYGKTLTDEVAGYIPAAFLSLVSTKKIIIGSDARKSSPPLKEILLNEFAACGVEVLDIGLVSTDMFYFACGTYKLPGIMITASHNPKEYNGFKLIKKLPLMIGKGNGMEELERAVQNKVTCEQSVSAGKKEINILDQYIDTLFTIVSKDSIKPIKVVVDSGNGMTGFIWERISKLIPIELIPMYFEQDGDFPNHAPNPSRAENRKDIEASVKKNNADIGIALDADGDRCFIIDEKGETVASGFTTALIATELLKESTEPQKILYTVNMSNAVRDRVLQLGHKVVVSKVGHSYIKQTMNDNQILFGGEVSGHYYFKDFFTADSGTLAALIMLKILSTEKKPLSTLVETFRERYHLGGEINIEITETDELFKELRTVYSDGKQSDVDGFSVEYEDWHGNVRKSNTGLPIIRVSVEAKTDALLKEKKNDIIKLIKDFQTD